MTDASSSFELLEFEQVQAGSRTVLLRLAARASGGLALDGLALVLDGGPELIRLTPLPAPAGGGDVVRAAFSTAPELLGPQTTYSLELADGSDVPLPAPTARSAVRRPLAPAPPAEHPDSPRIAEAEQRAASRRLAIVELQRRLSAEQARRTAAETEARTARAASTAEAASKVELRSRLADVEAESERIRAALEEANRSAAAEAEAAAALSSQVSDLEAAALALEARQTELRDELERAAAALEATRADLAERESELHAAGEHLAATRAGHAEELDAAATSAEGLRAQIVELELRLEDEQARLEAAQSDVQVGREQFAGVEAELAGVRAAAEEVAAALADRTTEVDLLREASLARERELEEQLVIQRRAFESDLAQLSAAVSAEDVFADEAPEPELGAAEPEGAEPDAMTVGDPVADGAAVSLADALLAETAAVELLRLVAAARSGPPPAAAAPVAPAVEVEPVIDRSEEIAELQARLDESRDAHAQVERRLTDLQREALDARGELAEAREQLAVATTEKSDLQGRLDQAMAARNLPPEAEAAERELIELRGAVERAQNRARLHRQHSSSLELELAEAKQELTELRHQVQAVTSSDEIAPPEEVESLREQVAYGEALAADLEWQLEEARVTEEAAEAALAIRAAEVELLSIALRELGAAADDLESS